MATKAQIVTSPGGLAIARTLERMAEGGLVSIAVLQNRLMPIGVDVPKILKGLQDAGLIETANGNLWLSPSGSLLIVAFHCYA